MPVQHRRLQRERQTIEKMIYIYCRGNHGIGKQLCTECHELLSYAMQRIDKCPFQSDKPTCVKCTIHCYKTKMREQVRQIMRYSGPRMIIFHPILALQHLTDGITKTPPKRLKKEK